MPYISTFVEPEVYLEHAGVTVWRVYKDGGESPWDYWFTTNKDTADECHAHGSGGHFDSRILAGKWSDTPNVHEWDEWWQARFKREYEAIEALIKAAIDEGRLPKSQR